MFLLRLRKPERKGYTSKVSMLDSYEDVANREKGGVVSFCLNAPGELIRIAVGSVSHDDGNLI